MLGRYYTRAVLRRSFSLVPLALFGISIVLFLLVLIPSIRTRLRNSAVFASVPANLRITGTAYVLLTGPNQQARKVPVPGVTVESGGFRTTTNTAGKYDLTFPAKEPSDVPLLFSLGGKEFVRRITFPPDEKPVSFDFVVP